MHRSPRPTAEDVVDLCTEPIRSQIERVRVAPRRIVRLDNDDPSSGAGQERGHRKTRHAATHDEIVAIQSRRHHGVILGETKSTITAASQRPVLCENRARRRF